MSYVSTWIAVAALAVVAVMIPVGMLVASAILRPRVEEQGKTNVYESGEVPTGNALVRFNIQYYMVALLFLVFDVETGFIVAWVVVYKDVVESVGLLQALGPMVLFLGTLLAALFWAWRIGAISWIREPLSEARSVKS